MWGREPAPAVRPAAVAGTWYPGEAGALRSTVEGMLAAAGPHESHGRARALVVPHAGLVYSGPTAAHGFALLHAGDFDRVIVMAPSHRYPLSGAAADPSTHYETPLGRTPVDVDAVRVLAARGFAEQARLFAREHAIEMQLPFLQVRLPGARLVPVLVGELRDDEFGPVAAALQSLLDDRTLVVASSDFTHFGPHYGYVPFTDDVQRRIHELDGAAIDCIETHDFAGFQALLARTGATICGRRPLGVLLQVLRPEWRAARLHYTTSGEITGDPAHSVSYACIAFFEAAPQPAAAAADLAAESVPGPVAGGGGKGDGGAGGKGARSGGDGGGPRAVAPPAGTCLAPAERRALLFAARQALEALHSEPALAARLDTLEATARLREPAAVFVSLHRRHDGRLRGCIGSLAARRPLLEAVTENAVAAATRDPRFDPLRPEELADLEIEISVLGPLAPVTDPEEIVVGRDGLVVTLDLQRGVLLPQVASQQRWTRVEFLEGVCRKAGLAADAWHQGARLERFEAEVFSESSIDAQ